MNILVLPNDMLYHITKFLPVSDKMIMRESCRELNIVVRLMEIRIDLMDCKFDKILNGRTYILSRLRLAALCGLHEHDVANIWAWVTLLDIKNDALPILRQISQAIYQNSKL